MGILLSNLLDDQPEGTFLICSGQEILIKVGTEWHLYIKYTTTGETHIQNRTIITVIANRTWAFS